MSEALTSEARARLLRDAAGTEPDPTGTGGVALLYGRYRVVRELGRGGMGVVYEAEDVALRRRVALKVLKLPARAGPGLAEQVLREARAAARLDHPHIAAVYDAYTGPEGDAIALQFVDGRPLSEIERPEVRALVAWLRDAALAVHHAHEQGIVHRDLKPHNLMIDGERVVVTDFGLAKELALDSSLSLSGSVLGTPSYMPPEQAGGRAREVDARSDVYALGATLYDRLAGRPPFVDTDLVALLRAVIEDEPRPLAELAPAVPRDLALVVHKCLAKEKERRYASARELADDLGRWLAGEPVRAEPPALGYRLEKFARRHRLVLSAAALLALVLLGAAAWTWTERAERRATEATLAVRDRIDVLTQQARLARAQPLEARARREEGIAVCRAFLERHESPQVYAQQGRLLRENGAAAEARAALDRALALAPDYAPARLERGLLLAEQGALGAADATASRERALLDLAVVETHPAELEPLEALFGRAVLAGLRGSLSESKRLFEELGRLDPGFIEVPLALTLLALEQGDPDEALKRAFGAMDLFRGFVPPPAARAAPSGAGAQVPGVAVTLEIPGIEGRFTERTAELAARPSTASAYAHRAQGELRRAVRAAGEGRLADAVAACEQARTDLDSALTLAPELAGARGERGLAELARARFLARLERAADARAALARARADLAAALAAAPESSVALENHALGARLAAEDAFARGATAEARETLDAALPALADALQRSPAEAGLWLARARLLALRTRFAPEAVVVDRTAAEADFERAIALAPWDARPRAFRGLARLAAGDVAGGTADVEAALFLGPEPELREEIVRALEADD